MSPRVLISTSSFGRTGRRPLQLLEEAGMEVVLNPHGRTLRPSETRELLVDADGLIAGTELLSREILAGAERLRVVSRCGTGMDNVDLSAADELGISVRNTPSAHVDAVAELTLAGILDLLRHVAAADRDLRRGTWDKPMGSLLRGRTVGIVGLGRVGRRLVELLEPFAPLLLANEPVQDPELAAAKGILYRPLETLLAESDVVSLHLPHGPGGGPILGAPQLAVMKPGSLLINTARGGLVDEAALAECLRSGPLAGAYLDVFAEEPYRGPLTELPNALLTPHIGSYAAEARLNMETQAVENLLELFAGEVER